MFFFCHRKWYSTHLLIRNQVMSFCMMLSIIQKGFHFHRVFNFFCVRCWVTLQPHIRLWFWFCFWIRACYAFISFELEAKQMRRRKKEVCFDVVVVGKKNFRKASHCKKVPCLFSMRWNISYIDRPKWNICCTNTKVGR